MPRGAYDTTIQEEIRRRGRRAPSSRLEEAGQTERDAAVRRMNIRRGKRTGQGPSAVSTAYTPERVGGKTSSRSKSGREGHEDTPGPRRGPRTEKGVPIPTPRPDYTAPDGGDWPWGIPGYTPPGRSAPFDQPPGGGGGGGGPGGLPIEPPPGGITNPVGIPPELLPIIAAGAGATSVAGRMRMYPSPDEIAATVMRETRSGVPAPYRYVDAEVIPPDLALPAPTRAAPAPMRALPPPPIALPPPAATVTPETRMLPSPTDVPIEIPLGDEKVKEPVKIKKTRKPKVKKPKLRM